VHDPSGPADLPPLFEPSLPPAFDAERIDPVPTRPVYDGVLADLYGIYLRHLLLMLLTFGWSRFWGRTRLRRYLWNHFAIFGDRFEYRGRGRELLFGFLVVLAVLGLWAAIVWSIWHFGLNERLLHGMSVVDVFFLSLALIGFPLSFVGHYSGLRYKLSRTRWRAIRCGMEGSAWRYGAIATFLNFANALCGRLLTPVVSVNLARPRIANARLGTQGFEFAGSAGDIYGRYIGYYFLNIAAWGAAIIVAILAAGGSVAELGFDRLRDAFAHPSPRTALLLLGAAVGLYLLFGLMILPLRCWWRAYLFRYLVGRTRAGPVLFATALTTRQMWGFLVLNYLIVLLSLGIGWPWVMHRTLRLIAGELWFYGEPNGAAIGQPADRGPRFGEGLLDMFDVSGV
jgi:uncharacterized membrane protein YjgN (DUF898 family)